MSGISTVVIGMHRSGTSAVTRAVNLLGVPLGRSGDCYSAPDNPSGHWESNSLCLANELILSQFHGSFTFPPDLQPGWEYSPKSEALLLQLTSLFFDVHKTDTWLWKDPRLSLTLPLWRRILRDFCVVLVIRNPQSVTDSLHRRDGLPMAYCHTLWESYNRSALGSIAGLPVVVVDFDAMEQDAVRSCELLSDHLAAVGVEISGSVDDAAKSITSRPHASMRDGYRSSADLWSGLQGLPAVSERFEEVSMPKTPLWVRAAMRSARIWSLRSALTS